MNIVEDKGNSPFVQIEQPIFGQKNDSKVNNQSILQLENNTLAQEHIGLLNSLDIPPVDVTRDLETGQTYATQISLSELANLNIESFNLNDLTLHDLLLSNSSEPEVPKVVAQQQEQKPEIQLASNETFLLDEDFVNNFETNLNGLEPQQSTINETGSWMSAFSAQSEFVAQPVNSTDGQFQPEMDINELLRIFDNSTSNCCVFNISSAFNNLTANVNNRNFIEFNHDSNASSHLEIKVNLFSFSFNSLLSL